MLKSFLILTIFLSVLVMIGTFIPEPLTDTINDAFVYFLSMIINFNFISEPITTALLNSMQILGNFYLGIAYFLMGRWLLNKTSGSA